MKVCPSKQARYSLRLKFTPRPKALKRKASVYQQGDLDGLCGIYSLINVTNHLRGPLTKAESSELLMELSESYIEDWGIFDALAYGINGYQLTKLLRKIVLPRYQLVCRKPFHSQPHTPIHTVLTKIRQWTEEGGAVIVSTEKHWTVVAKATEKSLHLKDSGNMRLLLRRTLHTTRDPHRKLLPQHTYFIKRLEDVL